MDSNNPKKESILSILGKLYWLEYQMEQLLLWETMIQSGEKAKESLFTLIHDSEIHKNQLEKWFDKLNLNKPSQPPHGFPEKTFDFAGKEVPEMFSEILKYELLAKGMYEYLMSQHEALKSLIIDDNDLTEFMSLLQNLATAETHHSEICRENIGSFRRIMGK
ncbi:MAG TPA: hypothetical protein VIO11_03570 [Candidatus Methanoperedens sp.]